MKSIRRVHLTLRRISRPIRSSNRHREKSKPQEPLQVEQPSFYTKYKSYIDNFVTTAVMIAVMIVVQNWYFRTPKDTAVTPPTATPPPPENPRDRFLK